MNFQGFVESGQLKPGSLEEAFGQVVDASPTSDVIQDAGPKPLQAEEGSHCDPKLNMFFNFSSRVHLCLVVCANKFPIKWPALWPRSYS